MIVYLSDLRRALPPVERRVWESVGRRVERDAAPAQRVGQLGRRDDLAPLDLFRNTSATNGSKCRPARLPALSHHVSERGTRRLLLFGGYGGEYLDDLWSGRLGSGHVDDAYYEGRTNPYPALLLPSTLLVSSRLSAFYPLRRRRLVAPLTPPGVRPSARDTPMGLAQPRAAPLRHTRPPVDELPADRLSDRVGVRTRARDVEASARAHDGPAAREETCSAIGRGPYGTRLFAFGGMREEHLYGGEPRPTSSGCMSPRACRPSSRGRTTRPAAAVPRQGRDVARLRLRRRRARLGAVRRQAAVRGAILGGQRADGAQRLHLVRAASHVEAADGRAPRRGAEHQPRRRRAAPPNLAASSHTRGWRASSSTTRPATTRCYPRRETD